MANQRISLNLNSAAETEAGNISFICMQFAMLAVQTLTAKSRVNQKLLSVSLALHALLTDPKPILPPMCVHTNGVAVPPLQQQGLNSLFQEQHLVSSPGSNFAQL